MSKKIISLAPNITDIIRKLGYSDYIVAHTNHSDIKNSEKIGNWLSPDFNRIKEINPDIIFTSDPLQEKIYEKLNKQFNVHHTEPSRLNHLFPLITDISTKIGDAGEAEKLNRNLQNRINRVRLIQEENSPVVYCEEWDTPPMVAGNWVPEMVRIAGGKYPFVEPGNRSRKISEEEFYEENTDVFISHICGRNLQQNPNNSREKWDYSGSIYFINDDYINNLSTRTVDGIEAISEIIYDVDLNKSSLYNHYK